MAEDLEEQIKLLRQIKESLDQKRAAYESKETPGIAAKTETVDELAQLFAKKEEEPQKTPWIKDVFSTWTEHRTEKTKAKLAHKEEETKTRQQTELLKLEQQKLHRDREETARKLELEGENIRLSHQTELAKYKDKTQKSLEAVKEQLSAVSEGEKAVSKRYMDEHAIREKLEAKLAQLTEQFADLNAKQKQRTTFEKSQQELLKKLETSQQAISELQSKKVELETKIKATQQNRITNFFHNESGVLSKALNPLKESINLLKQGAQQEQSNAKERMLKLEHALRSQEQELAKSLTEHAKQLTAYSERLKHTETNISEFTSKIQKQLTQSTQTISKDLSQRFSKELAQHTSGKWNLIGEWLVTRRKEAEQRLKQTDKKSLQQELWRNVKQLFSTFEKHYAKAQKEALTQTKTQYGELRQLIKIQRNESSRIDALWRKHFSDMETEHKRTLSLMHASVEREESTSKRIETLVMTMHKQMQKELTDQLETFEKKVNQQTIIHMQKLETERRKQQDLYTTSEKFKAQLEATKPLLLLHEKLNSTQIHNAKKIEEITKQFKSSLMNANLQSQQKIITLTKGFETSISKLKTEYTSMLTSQSRQHDQTTANLSITLSKQVAKTTESFEQTLKTNQKLFMEQFEETTQKYFDKERELAQQLEKQRTVNTKLEQQLTNLRISDRKDRIRLSLEKEDTKRKNDALKHKQEVLEQNILASQKKKQRFYNFLLSWKRIRANNKIAKLKQHELLQKSIADQVLAKKEGQAKVIEAQHKGNLIALQSKTAATTADRQALLIQTKVREHERTLRFKAFYSLIDRLKGKKIQQKVIEQKQKKEILEQRKVLAQKKKDRFYNFLLSWKRIRANNKIAKLKQRELLEKSVANQLLAKKEGEATFIEAKHRSRLDALQSKIAAHSADNQAALAKTKTREHEKTLRFKAFYSLIDRLKGKKIQQKVIEQKQKKEILEQRKVLAQKKKDRFYNFLLSWKRIRANNKIAKLKQHELLQKSIASQVLAKKEGQAKVIEAQHKGNLIALQSKTAATTADRQALLTQTKVREHERTLRFKAFYSIIDRIKHRKEQHRVLEQKQRAILAEERLRAQMGLLEDSRKIVARIQNYEKHYAQLTLKHESKLHTFTEDQKKFFIEQSKRQEVSEEERLLDLTAQHKKLTEHLSGLFSSRQKDLSNFMKTWREDYKKIDKQKSGLIQTQEIKHHNQITRTQELFANTLEKTAAASTFAAQQSEKKYLKQLARLEQRLVRAQQKPTQLYERIFSKEQQTQQRIKDIYSNTMDSLEQLASQHRKEQSASALSLAKTVSHISSLFSNTLTGSQKNTDQQIQSITKRFSEQLQELALQNKQFATHHILAHKKELRQTNRIWFMRYLSIDKRRKKEQEESVEQLESRHQEIVALLKEKQAKKEQLLAEKVELISSHAKDREHQLLKHVQTTAKLEKEYARRIAELKEQKNHLKKSVFKSVLESYWRFKERRLHLALQKKELIKRTKEENTKTIQTLQNKNIAIYNTAEKEIRALHITNSQLKDKLSTNASKTWHSLIEKWLTYKQLKKDRKLSKAKSERDTKEKVRIELQKEKTKQLDIKRQADLRFEQQKINYDIDILQHAAVNKKALIVEKERQETLREKAQQMFYLKRDTLDHSTASKQGERWHQTLRTWIMEHAKVRNNKIAAQRHEVQLNLAKKIELEHQKVVTEKIKRTFESKYLNRINSLFTKAQQQNAHLRHQLDKQTSKAQQLIENSTEQSNKSIQHLETSLMQRILGIIKHQERSTLQVRELKERQFEHDQLKIQSNEKLESQRIRQREIQQKEHAALLLLKAEEHAQLLQQKNMRHSKLSKTKLWTNVLSHWITKRSEVKRQAIAKSISQNHLKLDQAKHETIQLRSHLERLSNNLDNSMQAFRKSSENLPAILTKQFTALQTQSDQNIKSFTHSFVKMQKDQERSLIEQSKNFALQSRKEMQIAVHALETKNKELQKLLQEKQHLSGKYALLLHRKDLAVQRDRILADKEKNYYAYKQNRENDKQTNQLHQQELLVKRLQIKYNAIEQQRDHNHHHRIERLRNRHNIKELFVTSIVKRWISPEYKHAKIEMQLKLAKEKQQHITMLHQERLRLLSKEHQLKLSHEKFAIDQKMYAKDVHLEEDHQKQEMAMMIRSEEMKQRHKNMLFAHKERILKLKLDYKQQAKEKRKQENLHRAQVNAIAQPLHNSNDLMRAAVKELMQTPKMLKQYFINFTHQQERKEHQIKSLLLQKEKKLAEISGKQSLSRSFFTWLLERKKLKQELLHKSELKAIVEPLHHSNKLLQTTIKQVQETPRLLKNYFTTLFNQKQTQEDRTKALLLQKEKELVKLNNQKEKELATLHATHSFSRLFFTWITERKKQKQAIIEVKAQLTAKYTSKLSQVQQDRLIAKENQRQAFEEKEQDLAIDRLEQKRAIDQTMTSQHMLNLQNKGQIERQRLISEHKAYVADNKPLFFERIIRRILTIKKMRAHLRQEQLMHRQLLREKQSRIYAEIAQRERALKQQELENKARLQRQGITESALAAQKNAQAEIAIKRAKLELHIQKKQLQSSAKRLAYDQKLQLIKAKQEQRLLFQRQTKELSREEKLRAYYDQKLRSAEQLQKKQHKDILPLHEKTLYLKAKFQSRIEYIQSKIRLSQEKHQAKLARRRLDLEARRKGKLDYLRAKIELANQNEETKREARLRAVYDEKLAKAQRQKEIHTQQLEEQRIKLSKRSSFFQLRLRKLEIKRDMALKKQESQVKIEQERTRRAVQLEKIHQRINYDKRQMPEKLLRLENKLTAKSANTVQSITTDYQKSITVAQKKYDESLADLTTKFKHEQLLAEKHSEELIEKYQRTIETLREKQTTDKVTIKGLSTKNSIFSQFVAYIRERHQAKMERKLRILKTRQEHMIEERKEKLAYKEAKIRNALELSLYREKIRAELITMRRTIPTFAVVEQERLAFQKKQLKHIQSYIEDCYKLIERKKYAKAKDLYTTVRTIYSSLDPDRKIVVYDLSERLYRVLRDQ